LQSWLVWIQNTILQQYKAGQHILHAPSIIVIIAPLFNYVHLYNVSAYGAPTQIRMQFPVNYDNSTNIDFMLHWKPLQIILFEADMIRILK